MRDSRATDRGDANSPLTHRQVAVLAAIRRLQTQTGFPPTVRELAAELGIASPNGVHTHLARLVAKGRLRRAPHRARGLLLVEDPV